MPRDAYRNRKGRARIEAAFQQSELHSQIKGTIPGARESGREPEDVISITPGRVKAATAAMTVVTGAVHRAPFVLLSLFRFLLLSVSQLVKAARLPSAHA